MRFIFGLDQPHPVDTVGRKAPTGCCGKVFTSAKRYDYHAITCKTMRKISFSCRSKSFLTRTPCY